MIVNAQVERDLRRLELVITRRLNGMLHGNHLGLLPGAGSELDGSREYRPGEDEVRRMDWAVTARTTVPHVRDLIADRELATWLLVDATSSMDFGTAAMEKRELAAGAVAAVGFLTAGSGNRLGANVVHADGIRRFPALTGRSHLIGLLRWLLAMPRRPEVPAAPSQNSSTASASPPDLAAAIDGLARAVRRRGLVVVVSDFLDEDWETPLRRLAVRQQVLAIEVTDPRELELPDVGLITLVDPETGRRREVSTASRRLRARFAAEAARQRRTVKESLRRAGAAHLALRTDRDWVADIVRHVHAQRRLARAARQPGRGAA